MTRWVSNAIGLPAKSSNEHDVVTKSLKTRVANRQRKTQVLLEQPARLTDRVQPLRRPISRLKTTLRTNENNFTQVKQ
jgi:isochorismate synthase EntC